MNHASSQHDSWTSRTAHSQEIAGLYQNEAGFFRVIPERYRHANFSDMPLLPSKLVNHGKQLAWKEPLNSLILVGTYGSGKTHFAYAFIRELFRRFAGKKQFWPRVYTSPDLDAKLLARVQSGDEKTLIHYACTEDLLMVDDLGRETKSDRLRKQYFEIFNYRYSHNLPTIVTSNYAMEQLGEVIDGSIASRMQEWDYIQFPNTDLRKRHRFDSG